MLDFFFFFSFTTKYFIKFAADVHISLQGNINAYEIKYLSLISGYVFQVHLQQTGIIYSYQAAGYNKYATARN